MTLKLMSLLDNKEKNMPINPDLVVEVIQKKGQNMENYLKRPLLMQMVIKKKSSLPKDCLLVKMNYLSN